MSTPEPPAALEGPEQADLPAGNRLLSSIDAKLLQPALSLVALSEETELMIDDVDEASERVASLSSTEIYDRVPELAAAPHALETRPSDHAQQPPHAADPRPAEADLAAAEEQRVLEPPTAKAPEGAGPSAADRQPTPEWTPEWTLTAEAPPSDEPPLPSPAPRCWGYEWVNERTIE